MSGAVHALTHPIGTIFHPIRAAKRTLGIGGGGSAPLPPAPVAPTIDDATFSANQMQDQMRKRRGVYANIFGGNQNTAPTVATKSLLGT